MGRSRLAYQYNCCYCEKVMLFKLKQYNFPLCDKCAEFSMRVVKSNNGGPIVDHFPQNKGIHKRIKVSKEETVIMKTRKENVIN